jgi:quercetin dioxygenase-like cupin family protein
MTSAARTSILPPVDLASLVANAGGRRIAWRHASQDLNVNLIVLHAGEKITSHRNDEVDVLIVGVSGKGEITVDDATYLIAPETVILIPCGAQRGLCACEAPFAYLTCHHQRAQLWPQLPGIADRSPADEQ